jgi:two-component system response regulator
MGDKDSGDKFVRVLVIEDNPDDRELLLRQLRKAGMDSHVKFISDGKEAFNFLTGPQAPLPESLIAILLDLRLPSMSGLELLRKLRARDDFHSVPVTVMTSSNDPNDLEECRKLRVINYVSKPVTFTSFSKAIADVFHPPKLNDDRLKEPVT